MKDLRVKSLSVTPASDPWSSESSGSFVTLQLIPGLSWFDSGESLDPGLDSEFLRPLVNPTPAEKKVLFFLFIFFLVSNPKQDHRDQTCFLYAALGSLEDRLLHFKALELPIGNRRRGRSPRRSTRQQIRGREGAFRENSRRVKLIGFTR